MKKENAEAMKSMKDEMIESFKDALKEFADKSKKDENNDDDDDGDDGSNNGNKTNKSDDGGDKPPKKDDNNNDDDDDDKGSKQGKNHNNKSADKSQMTDTYEYLERHPDGTRKNYQY